MQTRFLSLRIQLTIFQFVAPSERSTWRITIPMFHRCAHINSVHIADGHFRKDDVTWQTMQDSVREAFCRPSLDLTPDESIFYIHDFVKPVFMIFSRIEI